MRLQVQSLASLTGLRIWRCGELWCRSQMWLGTRAAVALAEAGGYSPNSTPSLGTSICLGCGPRKGKKIKKKRIPLHSHVIQSQGLPIKMSLSETPRGGLATMGEHVYSSRGIYGACQSQYRPVSALPVCWNRTQGTFPCSLPGFPMNTLPNSRSGVTVT